MSCGFRLAHIRRKQAPGIESWYFLRLRTGRPQKPDPQREVRRPTGELHVFRGTTELPRQACIAAYKRSATGSSAARIYDDIDPVAQELIT